MRRASSSIQTHIIKDLDKVKKSLGGKYLLSLPKKTRQGSGKYKT